MHSMEERRRRPGANADAYIDATKERQATSKRSLLNIEPLYRRASAAATDAVLGRVLYFASASECLVPVL